MKIIIENKPCDDYFQYGTKNYEVDNFKCSAVLETNDENTATDVIRMAYKAGTIEGYLSASLLQAMLDVALYEAYAGNIKLKIYPEDYNMLEIIEDKEDIGEGNE